MDESLEGLLWLLTQIKASSTIMALLTGGAWPFQAPSGAQPPFAVVTPMAGHDVLGATATRLMFDGQYQVRVWGLADTSDTLNTIDNDIDALLQPSGRSSNGTTASAHIMACFRQNPLPPQPDWDGMELRIGIGGLYRVIVHAP